MSKKKVQSNGGNLITNYMQPKDKTQKPKTRASRINNKDSNYHESSRQAQSIREDSKTQVMHSDRQQWAAEQVQPRIAQVSLQLIMIAPCDTTYYQGFKKRAKDILDNYSKPNVVKFIMENARYDGITNMGNLQKIDDDQFWSKTVPSLIQMTADQKKQKSISSCIRMLVPKRGQILSISKAQIFLVIASMFVCIFPRQTNRKSSHYNLAQLMYISEKDGESANSIKLQKLKCIINYLKIMSKRKPKDLEKSKIEIQRSVNEIQEGQYRDIEYRMKEVEVRVGLVESAYCRDLVIDFANKNIGGGVLNRGAVQEEILFSIFPELIFMVCVCFEMKQNEALICYGAQRFNLYEGYSDTFKFAGTYSEEVHLKGPFQSIIIAVDAIDFKSSYREHNQYQPYLIEGELRKFLGGIQASDYAADEGMRVCTGKWGCGAFGGDFYLKFIIQWIACSIANKNMIFMCQNHDEKRELDIMVNFLKRFDTLEILQIIEEYNYYGQSKNTMLNFIDFIKKYST